MAAQLGNMMYAAGDIISAVVGVSVRVKNNTDGEVWLLGTDGVHMKLKPGEVHENHTAFTQWVVISVDDPGGWTGKIAYFQSEAKTDFTHELHWWFTNKSYDPKDVAHWLGINIDSLVKPSLLKPAVELGASKLAKYVFGACVCRTMHALLYLLCGQGDRAQDRYSHHRVLAACAQDQLTSRQCAALAR